MLKILKVTSLQCFYNVSKKKLGMELIFCMQINIKVSTSWHDSFWQKWPDISKVPKIRKECHNCFCVAKYSDVLWVSGHVLCYLLYNFLWYNFEKLKLVSAIFYQFFIFSPNASPSKTEKCFLFHLKSSFCSQDIQIFVFSSSPLFFPVSHRIRGWFNRNLKVYDVSII